MVILSRYRSIIGMGESAIVNVSGGQVQITESFSLPASCTVGGSATQGEVLIDDLTGSPLTSGRNTWSATVTATIKTPDIIGGNGRPDIPGEFATGVTVAGIWSTGDTASCVTDDSGQCDVGISSLSTECTICRLYGANSKWRAGDWRVHRIYRPPKSADYDLHILSTPSKF